MCSLSASIFYIYTKAINACSMALSKNELNIYSTSAYIRNITQYWQACVFQLLIPPDASVHTALLNWYCWAEEEEKTRYMTMNIDVCASR